jgi:ATP-binding cassette subfamily B (MDR/TAP) protein 1
MREDELGEERASEESCDYYSLYKDDATLKKETLPCSFAQLVRFSNPLDKILMAFGCLFALGNGVSLVFYAQPLKDLIMAFDPHSNPDEILANLTTAIRAFLMNSIFVFLNASLMTIAWTLSSQRQLIRVRSLYFKSLLAQEFAWYDRNRPEEVCSQMYIQTQRAQNSLVESVTGILTSLSMGFGGIILAFARGWQMAAVMVGFLPIMFLSNWLSARLAARW